MKRLLYLLPLSIFSCTGNNIQEAVQTERRISALETKVDSVISINENMQQKILGLEAQIEGIHNRFYAETSPNIEFDFK